MLCENRPVWYTDDIIYASNSCTKLARRAASTNDLNDVIRYNQARNALKTLITNSKKGYYQHYLEIYANDSPKFWENIRLILGRDTTDSAYVQVTDSDSGLLSSYEETLNVINKFFTEIGPKLVKEIISAPDPETLTGNRDHLTTLNPPKCWSY